MYSTGIFISLVLLIGGVSISIYAYFYNLWDHFGPGPGFFPFILGMILTFLSTILFIKEIFKPRESKVLTSTPSHGNQVKILKYLLAFCFFYIFFNLLGYIIVIFSFIFFCLKGIEKQPFKNSFLVSILTTIVIHFLFVKWLKVMMPLGILHHFSKYLY
jgi:hypothetical protein